MKKIILTMVLFCVVCVSALAQNTITMKFSGRNQNNEWIPLSNVLVENQTQNWQEMIYYPDTMITMGSGVGIDDYLQNEKVKLFQNVPNPFDGVTDFALQLDEGQRVLLEIYDVNGKMVAQYENALPQGQHLFRTTLTAPQTYLLSAKTENDRLHIKMVNKGNGGENSIAYLGEGGSIQYQLKSDTKDDATHNFAIGDWMKYVGYANLCGTEYESVPVEKSQTQSETVNLVFTLPLAAVTVENATNITSTSARLNGNANGQECEVTERGFFYGMTANNLTTKVTASGVGNGDFQTEISNLLPGTHYYYKAYAKTITGMAYSNEISFQTNATLPTITTTSVSSITSMSATSGGNVTADGGATVTARGVCWSTSQNPTMADSHTTNGSGTGSFSSSITGLSANTTYYVRAYATNSVGTAYGNQVSFTTGSSSFTCGTSTVTDYDNNTYNTVQIGQQCWMAENLKTTHYSDGTSISLGGSSTSTTTAYRYYPNNDSSNVATYGYLYNWPAVMQNSSSSSANPSGVQGICPTGWHVPSDAEWTQLTNYVSSQSQYVCGSNSTYIAKALASTTGWNSYSGTCCVGNDPSGNNATGFSAVPAGRRLTGNFYDFGRLANFWSATQSDDSFAWYRYLGYDGSGVYSYDDTKNYGFSVRCLRDAGSSASLPTVTTTSVTSITQNSATSGGNVTADGGATVTARGVCWSTSQNPTMADSHTTNGSGTGSFSSSITGLSANTTYYVRAYATNSVGTAYGSQISFTPAAGQPCPGVATVTDYDGNTYNTVQIGQQCWMKENLKTTHYSDGTSISLGSSTSTTTAYRYNPYNDSSNVATYGYLYNWKAVMRNSSSSSSNPSGVQGICPTGWHVPSDAEWTQLTDYVSSQSQYVCGSNSTCIAKALASTTGWNSSTSTCAVGNDPSGNNATGFSAVPAGYYLIGNFYYFGGIAPFWSATKYDGNRAWYRCLGSNSSDVTSNNVDKGYGFSVRCLRDAGSSASLPTVSTTTVTSITSTSATSGGNVTAEGGATVTARGVCWSTSQNPTVSNSHTTNGSGPGSFTSSITGLSANTTYYVRAYATNSVGTAYGNQVSFITVNYDGQPCTGMATVTDYDGNTYNTVQIGPQCWMKENLKTTHYSDGTSISLGSSTSFTTAYRYYPNNDSSNVATYGYLYNWPAVMQNSSSSSANPSGVQGICPTGWHVPSYAEWTQLTDYVSSQSQYVCGSNSTYIAKALASTTGWNSSTSTCAVGNDPSGNNATGFSAVPAGRCSGGHCRDFGRLADFWSATQFGDYGAWSRCLASDDSLFYSYFFDKDYGFSVRCLSDAGSSASLPTVTTTSVTSITQNSATSGGNVTADGGATVTARGVCWSTSQNPTVSNSHTTNGSGTGSFSSSITGLSANTTYYVRAYATNSVGTAYGSQISFTTSAATADGQPCPSTATVTDYDGNTYNTVQIGQQCWMKENLKTTHYSDGTSISLGSGTSTTTAYRYYPNNDSSNVSTYGYLYNWPAVMQNSSSSSANPSGVQGICPTGWHVPSDAEWTQLTYYVSSQSQYVCGSSSTYIAKALASTTGWNSSTSTCAVGNDPSGNNATGFSAVPAGSFFLGNFNYFGNYAYFWSATQDSDFYAWCRYLYSDASYVISNYGYKANGFSVRCLRD